VLDRRLGGIECRRVDPPVMMLAMCVCSYASVVGCGSVLERTAVALDRTCASVQTKNVAEPTN
jgi:hypothetical protein